MRTFTIFLAACLLVSTPCFAADATNPCKAGTSRDIITELQKLNFELELYVAGYESGQTEIDQEKGDRMCTISFQMFTLVNLMLEEDSQASGEGFHNTIKSAGNALSNSGVVCTPPPGESTKKL